MLVNKKEIILKEKKEMKIKGVKLKQIFQPQQKTMVYVGQQQKRWHYVKQKERSVNLKGN